jgi:N-acetyl-gamma-glutamyl-phosphate/LysW-gamma-L-alpha-aminoadipyl-6-phosphate reductase
VPVVTLDVSVIGGSGYTGGELIRLLLRHPEVELGRVTSSKHAGLPVHTVHPNLRRATDLKFTVWEELEPCDVLFTAVPHGAAMRHMAEYMELGGRVVDLSADFRLREPADYPKWYGTEHALPELLGKFVYGIPELHREELRGARHVAGPGCLASAAILGLYPLLKNGLIETDPVVVDAKVGSSAAGLEPSQSSHHPERSHVVRLYAGTGHRHTAEIEQELDFGTRPRVSFTAHAIEMVRGVAATSHVFVREEHRESIRDRDIWTTYREEYGDEPFMRLVKDKRGVYRYPEPKILAGTNYCDVGFELDPHSNRLVVASAIDNLMKGAAGGAIQCMNIMCGLEETAGLDALGLHPI